MNYQIRDESDPRRYYTQIPNIVDDSGLSVHAFRLYVHLKRVAGDDGSCWQSVTTLANACKMSRGIVGKARDELEIANLIKTERVDNPHGGRDFITIVITDIWKMNMDLYTSSPGELANPLHELASSPHELKNNPIKNNPIKKESSAAKKTAAEVDALLPSSPGGRKLFAKLQANAQVKNRRGPKRYETPQQRDKFLDAEKRLTPEELDQAIDAALEQGIEARGRIISYIAKWGIRQGNYNKSGWNKRQYERSVPEGI